MEAGPKQKAIDPGPDRCPSRECGCVFGEDLQIKGDPRKGEAKDRWRTRRSRGKGATDDLRAGKRGGAGHRRGRQEREKGQKGKGRGRSGKRKDKKKAP